MGEHLIGVNLKGLRRVKCSENQSSGECGTYLCSSLYYKKNFSTLGMS